MQEQPGQDAMNDSQKEYFIAGVIDFGDATDTYYVFEVAIIITYMMLESKIIDPLQVGGHVLAGYLTEMELNEQEWNILKVCVAARFIQSLVIGEYSHLLDPGNVYLLTTAENGWKQVQLLWNTPKDKLYKSWKSIVQTYK